MEHQAYKSVNKSVRKKDAMQLLLGKPVYTDDVTPKDALVVKILRSPHANAIVEQAVKDYRIEQARVKANPQNSDHAKAEVRKLERFFRSDWFEVLTDVDGRLVLSRLKKEAA